jgi:hypothetical protein
MRSVQESVLKQWSSPFWPTHINCTFPCQDVRHHQPDVRESGSLMNALLDIDDHSSQFNYFITLHVQLMNGLKLSHISKMVYSG